MQTGVSAHLDRPRVVLEQYVIPRYRVPFFAALAEKVDLLVVASKDRTVDGVTDVRDRLPFQSVRLVEEPGTNYHPDIGRSLREHQAQVWVSYDHAVERFRGGKFIAKYALQQGVRRLHWGCDGYLVRDFVAYRRHFNSPWREPRTHLIWRRERKHLQALDGFIAYSSHTASFYEAVFDIPRDRITVAHNAIDTQVIQEVRRQREAIGALRDPLRIAFVGRMTEGKGVDTLLHAFSEVSRRLPGSSLVFVGDGSGREAWEKLALQLGLGDVHFLGAVFDDRELADILCKCSLFVLPGLGGLALNAAMAAGLPVVCTHGDGTELDLVHEGVNGWHFPPGDTHALAAALMRALEDAERLRSMGRASAALVEIEFSLSAMVDAYASRIALAITESYGAGGA